MSDLIQLSWFPALLLGISLPGIVAELRCGKRLFAASCIVSLLCFAWCTILSVAVSG